MKWHQQNQIRQPGWLEFRTLCNNIEIFYTTLTSVSIFHIIPTEYCISVFVFGSTDIVATGNRTIPSSSLVPLYRKVFG